jgi:O-antigen/teichoic acid export membrane protein
MSLAAITRDRIPPGFFGPGLRRTVASYCQLLAGTAGRVGLQAVYFFVLANTLSLSAMGIFASASAAGLMLASFSGLGFGSLAFRAAAGRPRLLGRYMGLFFGLLCFTAPLGVLIALPFYSPLFSHAISLTAFINILLVEMVVWRIVELLTTVHNGMGDYTAGSMTITTASALRAGGAVLFAFFGNGGIEQWAIFYAVANTVALATVWFWLRPAVTPRWSTRLLRNRLKEGLMFAVSYFALNAQGQIDKLIVLSITGPQFAGIYAIATRIIDFTAVPFRSFYTLYTRKLFGEGKKIGNALRRTLTVEGAILSLSTVAFLALTALLWWWPDLLGPNVAVAAQLFAPMLIVPALRNLMEFHGELFFVHGRMAARALVAVSLVCVNAAALALLLSHASSLLQVGLGLSLIHLLLYLLSAGALYRFITQESRS